MKALRESAKRHQKRGLSASQAMGKAVDEMVAETTKHLESIRQQAMPKINRKIRERLSA